MPFFIILTALLNELIRIFVSYTLEVIKRTLIFFQYFLHFFFHYLEGPEIDENALYATVNKNPVSNGVSLGNMFDPFASPNAEGNQTSIQVCASRGSFMVVLLS